MNQRAEAAQLLHNLGGGDLMGRTSTLRPAQRKLVAEFAVKHGLLVAAQSLYVGIDELEHCLSEAGFHRCSMCEHFFTSLSNGLCGVCSVEE